MQVCGVDRHATKTSKLIVESIINGMKNIKVDTVQFWTTFVSKLLHFLDSWCYYMNEKHILYIFKNDTGYILVHGEKSLSLHLK